MKLNFPRIDWEAIYVWFIVLFFFVNALSALAKTSAAMEIAFVIFYTGLLIAIKKYPRLTGILLDNKLVIPAGIIVLIGYFFVAFPIKDINSIPFHEDFVQFYTLSMQGINTLMHGSVFGWNSSMLGGYYTASDMVSDKAFFLLPFMAFGSRVGFHLMILAFILAIPLLIYWFISLKSSETTTRSIAFILAVPFALYYFRSALRTGTLDSMMAAPFFILNLIALELLYQKKRYAGFLLGLSLVLTFYLHMGIFILSSLFIFAEWLIREDKPENFRRLGLIAVLALLATMNFTGFFLSDPGYFTLNNGQFAASPMGSLNMFAWVGDLISELERLAVLNFAPHELLGLVFIFLPAILLFRKYYKNVIEAAKYFWFLAAAAVISIAGRSTLILIFQSANHILPIFLAVVLTFLLSAEFKRFRLLAISILICIPVVVSPSPERFPHVKDLASFDKSLVANIKKMDGNMILLEARDTWNLVSDAGKQSEPDPLRIHAESLFPMETGKNFFTYYTAGYSHSRFRGNALDSGSFRGHMISDYPVNTFNGLMKKWGIRYLILWSSASRDYFSRYPQYYRLIWHDKNWYEYKFLGADTRSVASPHGSGILKNDDPFGKRVELSSVRKNDEIVVRSDMMPQWKAYYNGSPIPLYAKDGQMAFRAPADGNYVITMRFPKYALFSLISLCSLACIFLLSHFRVL